MSQELRDELPEGFKDIWSLKKDPNVVRMKYEALSDAEALKERYRKTSTLYKCVFGEDIFQFVTTDGKLHLNVEFLDVVGRIKELEESAKSELIRHDALIELPSNGETAIVITVDGQSRDAVVKHYSGQEALLAKDRSVSLQQVADDFKKYAGRKYMYLTQEVREMTQAIQSMHRSFINMPLKPEHQLYFKEALKITPLRRAFANINWRRYFSS